MKERETLLEQIEALKIKRNDLKEKIERHEKDLDKYLDELNLDPNTPEHPRVDLREIALLLSHRLMPIKRNSQGQLIGKIPVEVYDRSGIGTEQSGIGLPTPVNDPYHLASLRLEKTGLTIEVNQLSSRCKVYENAIEYLLTEHNYRLLSISIDESTHRYHAKSNFDTVKNALVMHYNLHQTGDTRLECNPPIYQCEFEDDNKEHHMRTKEQQKIQRWTFGA